MDEPHIPEFTAEQLKECGALVQEGIESRLHSVDARVELDENGRVLDVTTQGEPNPDVGMCIRVALRGMRVRQDLIDDAALRSTSYGSANAGTMPNRAYMGEIVTVTVVVIVFVEVIIETVAVTVGVAVTATVAKEAVRAAQARSAATSRRAPAPDNYRGRYHGGSACAGKAPPTGRLGCTPSHSSEVQGSSRIQGR